MAGSFGYDGLFLTELKKQGCEGAGEDYVVMTSFLQRDTSRQPAGDSRLTAAVLTGR